MENKQLRFYLETISNKSLGEVFAIVKDLDPTFKSTKKELRDTLRIWFNQHPEIDMGLFDAQLGQDVIVSSTQVSKALKIKRHLLNLMVESNVLPLFEHVNLSEEENVYGDWVSLRYFKLEDVYKCYTGDIDYVSLVKEYQKQQTEIRKQELDSNRKRYVTDLKGFLFNKYGQSFSDADLDFWTAGLFNPYHISENETMIKSVLNLVYPVKTDYHVCIPFMARGHINYVCIDTLHKWFFVIDTQKTSQESIIPMGANELKLGQYPFEHIDRPLKKLGYRNLSYERIYNVSDIHVKELYSKKFLENYKDW